MPNKIRQEMTRTTRVTGDGPGITKPQKPKKSFMDRVRELAALDKQEPKDSPEARKQKREGQKGSSMQEIQERAMKIESE